MDDKVLEWRERGVAVHVRRRTNRQGYKAGALKEGMMALATPTTYGALDHNTHSTGQLKNTQQHMWHVHHPMQGIQQQPLPSQPHACTQTPGYCNPVHHGHTTPCYIAVLDADFRPEPDFLLATVPFLEGSPDVAFVQTRWVFANATESYLTRVSENEGGVLGCVRR